MEGHSKISLKGVSRRFSAKNSASTIALDNVGLEIAPHEVVCVVGPSGCGKTTLLNIVAGFDRATQGQVLMDGKPIKGVSPERAVVFQTAALFPWLTVFENLVFGARSRGLPRSEYEDRANHLLDAVGLSGFGAHYPYQLSIGMRQRVQIARALLMNPEVILMDEPFGALDFQTRLVMQELMQTVWNEFRPTILFITHDVEEAVYIGDRVVVMSRRPGRIIEDIQVPFAKPRDYEVTSSAPFQELKNRVLHLIRSQGTPQVRAAEC
jgi:NitT/TauT family transport system ATP-binding protein